MTESKFYWDRVTVTRRNALRGAGAAGAGAVALSLVGCGGSDTGTGATRDTSGAALDWTKGKPGGTMNIQVNTFPVNFDFITATTSARVAGFSYSGLLAFKAGKSGVDPTSLDPEPDTAQALPEQPNEQTYIFKLRPDVKFHNGRAMTSEDVKYSLDFYASDKSVHKESYSWIDKVEAPDAQTVTVRTNFPYSEGLLNLVAYSHPYIFAKEYLETPASIEKMMGTGPFIHVSTQSPVSVNFRRNPDYYMKPLPYFDQLTFQGITDTPRQAADFISKQIHFTWYYTPEYREQIKRARPEAPMTEYENFGHCVIIRCDQAPFTDKRLRQALSMTIDRKQLRDGVFEGEGQDDQALSIALKYWGFRKPSELKSAKYWKHDPAEAKKLLAAAGIDKPIEKTITIANQASNQQILQQGTLIEAKWKELGVVNTKIATLTTAQFGSSVNIGHFDDMAMFSNQQVALVGTWLKNRFWSPPEGVKAPTQNTGHVNNAELSRLFEKQLGQLKIEERKSTFRDIEEIIGEEQYRFVLSTATQAWFLDPGLRNAEVFSFSTNSNAAFTKYWWFDQA